MARQNPITPVHLRATISQCWTTQLILLLGLLTLSFLQSAIRDDFSVFLYDSGEEGWRAFCVLVPLYALMPILVHLHEGTWFRWLNAALLFLTILLPIGHQVKHIILDGKLPDIAVATEIAMVLIGITGCVSAMRWARSTGIAAQ